MSEKRYTAEEMYDAADWFEREDYHANAPGIEQMLRQAADTEEENAQLKAQLKMVIRAARGK